MAGFDDLKLDKTPVVPPPRQPRWLAITAAAVLLIALAAVWYYLRRGPGDAPASSGTEQTVPQAGAKPLSDPAADANLPPLDASDAFVRDLVRALSEHPIVAAWLTSDQLIRGFTVSVMNVADGETPAGHLYTIRPEGPFRTRQQGDRSYIDRRSYARYDGHAAAIASLDSAGAGRLYTTLKPRIEEAYRELAGPNAEFDRTLQRAIIQLLETPVVEGEVALEPRTAGYAYADPALESLPRARQQLLRMGPDNVRVVQAKLREIAPYLGIDEASLPSER